MIRHICPLVHGRPRNGGAHWALQVGGRECERDTSARRQAFQADLGLPALPSLPSSTHCCQPLASQPLVLSYTLSP